MLTFGFNEINDLICNKNIYNQRELDLHHLTFSKRPTDPLVPANSWISKGGACIFSHPVSFVSRQRSLQP